MFDKNLPGSQNIAVMDERLRKAISEYYFTLKKMGDSEKAVKLLAQHVAIMVEMINDFKGEGQ